MGDQLKDPAGCQNDTFIKRLSILILSNHCYQDLTAIVDLDILDYDALAPPSSPHLR